MDKVIEIKYQPNIEQLTKVSKYLLLNSTIVKYLPLAFIFLFLFTKAPMLFGSISEDKTDYLRDIFTFCLVISVWLFVYFRTLSIMKKNILTNKRNFELQKITFTTKSFIQQGETFKIENFWDEAYQIKETKDWFLIYLKKNSALPIIKTDLKDNQYNELKELFNSLNIKKSLK